MTSFLPHGDVLVSYTVACIVLFVTPGPDMSLFLSRTIAGGRRAGMAAMFGAMAGCCVHTLLAAVGLSALIAASTVAFAALKIVGALYLLWLAVDAIRRGSALSVDARRPEDASLGRTFLVGLGVNLTNPKVVLFFVTFLPQFVEAGDPAASSQLFFLGLYFVVISIPLAAVMISFAERLLGMLRARPRILRRLDYLFAGVFGAFAVTILATGSR